MKFDVVYNNHNVYITVHSDPTRPKQIVVPITHVQLLLDALHKCYNEHVTVGTFEDNNTAQLYVANKTPIALGSWYTDLLKRITSLERIYERLQSQANGLTTDVQGIYKKIEPPYSKDEIRAVEVTIMKMKQRIESIEKVITNNKNLFYEW